MLGQPPRVRGPEQVCRAGLCLCHSAPPGSKHSQTPVTPDPQQLLSSPCTFHASCRSAVKLPVLLGPPGLRVTAENGPSPRAAASFTRADARAGTNPRCCFASVQSQDTVTPSHLPLIGRTYGHAQSPPCHWGGSGYYQIIMLILYMYVYV